MSKRRIRLRYKDRPDQIIAFVEALDKILPGALEQVGQNGLGPELAEWIGESIAKIADAKAISVEKTDYYEGIPIYCAAPVDAFGVVTGAEIKPVKLRFKISGLLIEDGQEPHLHGFWLTRNGLGHGPGSGFANLVLGRDAIETTWAEVRKRLKRGY